MSEVITPSSRLVSRTGGTCRECKFNTGSSGIGRCYRYPPVRIPKGGLIALLGFWGLAGVNWEYPNVQSNWTCGEFKPRD